MNGRNVVLKFLCGVLAVNRPTGIEQLKIKRAAKVFEHPSGTNQISARWSGHDMAETEYSNFSQWKDDLLLREAALCAGNRKALFQEKRNNRETTAAVYLRQVVKRFAHKESTIPGRLATYGLEKTPRPKPDIFINAVLEASEIFATATALTPTSSMEQFARGVKAWVELAEGVK
jgi:hypothetical protein